MADINISKGELDIMKLLWDKGELSFPQLIAVLVEQGKEMGTCRTYLARLYQKGMISREGQKRSFRYKALISQEEYQLYAGKYLVNQIFGANVGQMVRFMVSNSKISRSDAEDIKTLLEQSVRDE